MTVSQSELDIDWTMVVDDEGLAAAAAALAAGSGPVAVDAERASGFRYGGEAYLVQVHRAEAGTFLIDPIGIPDFSPLQRAIGDAEWIFHAASQDLPCLASIGLVPSRIFDTELAARLLGFERVGLGAIVEMLLGIALEKAHSAADWSQRPLPAEWLEYAALDVVLLPELRSVIAEQLDEQGKTEFAAQEFEAVRLRPEKPRPEEPWRKLSGSHALKTPRALALARELWEARDALARERDTAPGRLIPDSSIVAASIANPRSPGDLARLRDFKGRASRSELKRWWAAILRAKTTEDLPGQKPRDPDSIPHHRFWAQRDPAAAARLEAVRSAIDAEAAARRIPVENLLTPDTLRRLVWRPPADPTAENVARRLSELGARDWQVGITAPIIASAFVDLP
ncbi:ribonuclease D [Leucobacter chromiiresistens]|uniref:Ribonuclease D n=1 Tax=Leucobacter chromiiresistens TaxID=1079994 RepID=A0A1H0ZWH8_9MICO|nr:ribonuclease D [Leucobacter chromiiresistens]SDQ31719.1 ribonuclease D [Leucobacter chromiiresistens]